MSHGDKDLAALRRHMNPECLFNKIDGHALVQLCAARFWFVLNTVLDHAKMSERILRARALFVL